MKKLPVLLYIILSFSGMAFLHAQVPFLFAMTPSGGTYGEGAIIAYNLNTNTETVVWSFGNGIDGTNPQRDLVYDTASGLLFGMTQNGGSSGRGTIFSFNPVTQTETVLVNLDSASGYNPFGNLVYDPIDSLYYGLEYTGGAYSLGTIIGFNPRTDTANAVYNFNPHVGDGYEPVGSVMFNPKDSNLDLETPHGGGMFNGTKIKFSPALRTELSLNDFGMIDCCPQGSFTYNPIDGKAYSGLQGGTTIYGLIYSFDYTNSYLFNGPPNDAGFPGSCDLIFDKNDSLMYMMTYEGGQNNNGALASYNPSTMKDSLLWSFGGAGDGNSPNGGLLFDATGNKLYGMTAIGGSNGSGVLFRFDPVKDTEKVLWNFGATGDGSSPNGAPIMLNLSLTALNNVSLNSGFTINPNPSNGMFVIGSAAKQSPSRIEIYNVLGECILKETLRGTQGDKVINLSIQPNGVYLYRIIDEDGRMQGQGKLVIQK